MRALLATTLLTAAIPAQAQDIYCHAENFANGTVSHINAYIGAGPAMRGLFITNGPIVNPMAFDAASGLHLRTKGTPQAMLYTYRLGHSVPGKDWRQPASVFSEIGGLGISFPRFWDEKEKEPSSITVRLRLGTLVHQGTQPYKLGGPGDFAGFVVPILDAMWDLYPNNWYKMGFRHDLPKYGPAWRAGIDKAVREGIPLEVEFLHGEGPKKGQPLALTRFKLPSGAELQARFASDIEHFRKVAAAGKCIPW